MTAKLRSNAKGCSKRTNESSVERPSLYTGTRLQHSTEMVRVLGVFFDQEPFQWRNYYHNFMGLIINYCLKLPSERAPVAVDRSQLQTMVSLTVDQIDWQLPTTYSRQCRLKHQLHTQCTLQYASYSGRAAELYRLRREHSL